MLFDFDHCMIDTSKTPVWLVFSYVGYGRSPVVTCGEEAAD